jgi:hypothetical protein
MFVAEQDSAMMGRNIDMNPSRWSMCPVLVVLDLSKTISQSISEALLISHLNQHCGLYSKTEGGKEERRKKNMFRGMYIVY